MTDLSFWRKSLRLAFMALVACGIMAQQAPQPAIKSGDPAAFTVLAEPQLALPMTELTRMYSLHRRATVLTAFDDSRTQLNKLLEGESGDVIITSLPAVATELKLRGMIDVYSQATVTADKLVLAARKSDTLDNRRSLVEALQEKPVLLADPKRYVEGLFGQQTLHYLFYDKPVPVEPRLFNSRNAMYEAVRGGQGIGILLQSEAGRLDPASLRVPVADGSYPPIVYHGYAIAGDNMPIARDFLEFLKSPEAQLIFRRYGFSER